MKTPDDVEKFLTTLFPDRAKDDVLRAFDCAFFSGLYRPTDQKRVWEKAVQKIETALRRIKDGDPNEEAVSGLASEILQACEVDITGLDIAEIRIMLSDQALMERIWHKHNPKTGGSDPADYIVADWVKMGFEDLGCQVTWGVSAINGSHPSTRFGRVVKAALEFRRSLTDWRRPAEAVAKGRWPQQ